MNWDASIKFPMDSITKAKKPEQALARETKSGNAI
jgi:hypothetical protein